MMTKKKDGFQNLSIWAVRIVFIIYFLLSVIKLMQEFKLVSILQIAVFGIYIIVLLKSIRKKGPLWEGTIFLYSFFLFLLARIFLDFINVKSMYVSDRYAWYTISEKTTEIILTSYIIFLLVFYIVLVFSKEEHSVSYGKYRFRYGSLPGLEKITGIILMILLPVGIIYKFYLNLTQSYLANYQFSGGGPSIVALLSYFAEYTIPVYFCTIPKSRNRKVIFAMVALYYLMQSLQGQRSAILLIAVFFLWYALSVGKIFKARTVVFSGSFLVVFTVIITYIREATGYFSNQNIFVKMLYSAGGTHMVFANYIDYRSRIINDIPLYFLSGLIQPFNRYFFNRAAFSQGRNAIMAATSFSLDHKLMYALAPAAFESGRGFGSNFITEFWAYGGFLGVIILSFLFLKFVQFVEKKSYRQRIWFIFQFYMLREFIWCPRGTSLPNSVLVLISYIIFFVLYQVLYGKIVIKERSVIISISKK